jgi:diguanylate cyclase (GGDEF)-like protein
MTDMLEQPPTPLLVLDTETADAEALASELAPFGYAVAAAGDLSDPAALAERAEAEFVLARIRRGRDNRPVHRAALALARSARQPRVIALSDEANLDARILAVRAGSSAFVAAPYNAFDIVDRMEALGGPSRDDPYRVLVVDDDPFIARYHAEVLSAAGMAVQQVAEPPKLLDYLADFRPELILMDFYMPDIDGRELAAVIRQEPAYDSIPIVFLSAEDNAEMQQKVMRIGGDDFLTKPIREDHLVSSVLVRARRFRSLRATMLRDSLTGLLNHTATKEQVSVALSRMRRHGHDMALAMIDLDRFKSVNDTYGHPVGDQVLRSLAHLLKQRLRTTDIIGRYGGEEFAIGLPETPLENAEAVLNQIRESFAEIAHNASGETFRVTFSCGLAGYPGCADATALTETADAALYRAKKEGRNRVILAQPTD